MKTITQSELEKLVEKTRSVLLTSNDIVPRTLYPYYHDHPSVPAELSAYKTIITAYRSVSDKFIRELGKQQMGQITIDLSQNNFHHLLLGGMVSATFGWGDCGECVSKLASEIILADCGDLLFVPLSLPNAQVGMETTHFLLVANMKAAPEKPQDNTLEALLTCLPDEAIVADPFLGLCFSPKDMPTAFKDYIKAYGGQAQVTQAVHIFNFTAKALADSFFPLMRQVISATRKALGNIYLLEGKELAESQSDTALVRKISCQTGLAFQAYQSTPSTIDIVVPIKTKADRRACVGIMAKFDCFSSEAAILRRTPEGVSLLVVRDIHNGLCDRVLKEITGVEQVALINVDFKWRDKRVTALEMDDAINRSGFKGYNVLHAGHSGSEAMLKRMMACLKSHYQRVHFILNDIKESYWPRNQIKDLSYYSNVYDFIAEAKSDPGAFEHDILIYGKNAVTISPVSTRTANEVQAWLMDEGIYIPVINASSMIDSADDKFIFSQAMGEGVPLTRLVDVKSLQEDVAGVAQHFSDKVLLKLRNLSEGRGILMLTKDELLANGEALEQYLSQGVRMVPMPLADVLGSYRSRKLRELFDGCRRHSQVLLQDYVASDPINHNDSCYDPTGRVVLLLRRAQDGERSLEVVDGYWKLPKRPVDQTQYDEEACLSSVNAEAYVATGAAKLTEIQLIDIKKAFGLLVVAWTDLLANKTDFYLSKVGSVPQLEQNLLTMYFTEQIFDKLSFRHLYQLVDVMQSVSGLGSLLVRTLNAELTSFLGLCNVGIEAPFFQKVLLHYLASQSCAIDFSTIDYFDPQENLALLINLERLSAMQIDESLKLNADLLLEKLKAVQALQEMQSQFHRCEQAANGYFKQKKYSLACAQWQKALGLVSKLRLSQEQKRASLAKLNNNLGAGYRELGEYGEAVQYFEASLQHRELGSEDYQKVEAKKTLCENKLQADRDNKMAVRLYKDGKWQAALDLFEKVLAVNEALFKDKPHLHVASACWSISSCYLKLGQSQKAIPHIKRAYEIRRILLGEEHDVTIKTRERYHSEASNESSSAFKAGLFTPVNPGSVTTKVSTSHTPAHSTP